MKRFRLIAVLALGSAVLAACAPSLGPPPPPPPPMHTPAPSANGFRPDDFSWSAVPGSGSLAGKLAYKAGKTRYTCAKSSVILTPETPWTRHRMTILYQSAERSALPADEVRARTPTAPAGDYSAFVRRTTCDAADRFAFSGLPNGAWYVITIGRPVGGGPNVALMRRVVTKAGKMAAADL